MELGDILVIAVVAIVILTVGAILFIPSLFTAPMANGETLASKGKAPELEGIHGYINAESIAIGPHVGKKVILIDFWTYTCINCIRTLPYLTAWDEKYRDDGLLIIGVHTPEFDFEKEYANVERAVEEHGIKYPVALDNDYKTWRAYNNRFWPAKYLIDKHGNIVYTHFGEGAYDETERIIQTLLTDLTNKTPDDQIGSVTGEAVAYGEIGTPELYFGQSFRRIGFGNEPARLEAGKEYTFTLPENSAPNQIYLEGTWKNNNDDIELVSESGKIVLLYKAKDVNIVGGSNEGSTIRVLVDNTMVQELPIKTFTLYPVVKGTDYTAHRLELEVRGAGFRVSSFTFG